MAEGFTYGVDFPFDTSLRGDALKMTETASDEIRASLLHLLLYEFLFEPLDVVSFDVIENDIRDSVAKYIPNLVINKIIIEPLDQNEEVQGNRLSVDDVGLSSRDKVYRSPGNGTYQNTAKIKIEYTTNNNSFSGSEFIIINI